jgi:mono/diheme cytochrome c family protein
MNIVRIGIAIVAPLFVAGALAAAQPSQSQGQLNGVSPWPRGPETPEPEYGSVPRHQVAMLGGIPEPYKSMSSPQATSRAIVQRGAAVYDENCVSCHGQTGMGDGRDSRRLSPHPGNLAWLSRMPMANWDPFMYWTIAEGGAQFGTGMPAYKGTLSRGDIWAVTAYIRARLPQNPN